jgi:hypothetical protein
MTIEPIKVDSVFIGMMDKLRRPSSDKLIESCAASPIVFAEKMLGLRLYSWQVYYLDNIVKAMEEGDNSREFIALTSRQIGKSTAIAVLAIWACVFNKKPGTVGNNTIFGITSASDVQAKKLLNEMKKMLHVGDGHMAYTYKDAEGKPLFGTKFFTNLLSKSEPNNTTTITFKGYEPEHKLLLKDSKVGSVIKSYPPTSVILGETFTFVVIDEAGKSDRISDQFFYDYIYPTGNFTNAVRLYTSTPWVCSGFFYRMVDPDGMYGGSPAIVYCFTIDAIERENPDYYLTVKRTVDQMNNDGKKDEVQRAYYCRFVKGEISFFDPTAVWNCFSKIHAKKEGFIHPCDCAIDFGGKVRSRTVVTLSYFNEENKAVRLYDKVYEPNTDENLVEDLKELKTRFNIQRFIPEQCAQGDYIIKQMIQLGWDVHPVDPKAEKVKKYGAFRSMLNRGEIISYEDEDLRQEMLALEYSSHRRNSIIEHAPGYYDDRIDSFMYSCYFYLQEDTGIKTYKVNEVKQTPDSCYACGSKKYEVMKGMYMDRKCKECGYEWRT